MFATIIVRFLALLQVAALASAISLALLGLDEWSVVGVNQALRDVKVPVGWFMAASLWGLFISLWLDYVLRNWDYVDRLGEYYSEIVVDGNKFLQGKEPACQLNIGRKIGSRIGHAVRVGDYLVVPTHLLTEAKDVYVWREEGKHHVLARKCFEEIAPDVSLAYLTLNEWSRLGAAKPRVYKCGNSFAQICSEGRMSQGPTRAAGARWMFSYEGTTVPGFSGAAYMSAGRLVGMHLGGGGPGFVNVGVDATFIEASLSLIGEDTGDVMAEYVPEDPDDVYETRGRRLVRSRDGRWKASKQLVQDAIDGSLTERRARYDEVRDEIERRYSRLVEMQTTRFGAVDKKTRRNVIRNVAKEYGVGNAELEEMGVVFEQESGDSPSGEELRPAPRSEPAVRPVASYVEHPDRIVVPVIAPTPRERTPMTVTDPLPVDMLLTRLNEMNEQLKIMSKRIDDVQFQVRPVAVVAHPEQPPAVPPRVTVSQPPVQMPVPQPMPTVVASSSSAMAGSNPFIVDQAQGPTESSKNYRKRMNIERRLMDHLQRGGWLR